MLEVPTDAVDIESAMRQMGTESLSQAREKSRDAKRVADVKQLQTALELFYADAGHYPAGNGLIMGSDQAKRLCDAGWSVGTCASITYMGTAPSAPVPADAPCSDASNAYTYAAQPDGQHYELGFCTGSAVGSVVAGQHTASETGIR